MYKYFLNFKLLASNTIRNQTGRKLKSFIGINLVESSSKFVAHIKKHLGHTDAQKMIKIIG